MSKPYTPPEQALRFEVAARIKSQRLALNLSLSELADKTGLGFSTVWQYESGKVLPDLTCFRLLAIALQVSTDWLLCLELYNLDFPRMERKK